MKQLIRKLRPAGGLSHLVHLLFTVLLPAVVFILVRISFVQLAYVVVLLSKWRMLAVRPRYWIANIRANAVDLTVGLSFVVFMSHSHSQLWQFILAAIYGLWLVIIKPGSSTLKVSVQALVAQTVGLTALFLNFQDASLLLLTFLAWIVCYSSARHFFTSFDEVLTPFLSTMWGYVGAALTWILGHWLLYYGQLAQPTLLLCVLGFGFATIYYLEKNDRLSKLLLRQFVFIIVAIIVIVLAFSSWGDKTI